MMSWSKAGRLMREMEAKLTICTKAANSLLTQGIKGVIPHCWVSAKAVARKVEAVGIK